MFLNSSNTTFLVKFAGAPVATNASVSLAGVGATTVTAENFSGVSTQNLSGLATVVNDTRPKAETQATTVVIIVGLSTFM